MYNEVETSASPLTTPVIKSHPITNYRTNNPMHGLTLNATYITTATVDTLTDHCNGDHELLISSYMSADPDLAVAGDDVIASLLYKCNGADFERLPFVATEVEAALTAVIASIPSSDLISDDEDEDRMVWVLNCSVITTQM
jgi:hypothetical protein